MAKAQHRTREYVAAYHAVKQAQAAGELLTCVEPICLFRTRLITPWQRASVSHDQTGTRILGPSHLKCNLSEAAIRGNKQRGAKRRRWAL
jgi:hypothetical protein